MKIEIVKEHLVFLLISILIVIGIGMVVAQAPNPGHLLSQIWADTDFDMGGHKITNVALPTDTGDAATKGYVDQTGPTADCEWIVCDLVPDENTACQCGDREYMHGIKQFRGPDGSLAALFVATFHIECCKFGEI